MPDSFDANGLQVATAAEITATLNAGLLAISPGLNLEQNSPDGQRVGIITQMAVDMRELLVMINASFDPDAAQGITLDQRAALNNIKRLGGSYTIQPIDITVSKTVELEGLDANANNPLGTGYTVQDGSGNSFILEDTTTLTAGTTTLNFRAALIGAVNVPVDTITVPVTIIPGVTAVNNSSAALSIGEPQETQPQFRTRRDQTTAIATTGYLNGLLGKVLNLPGVTEAQLYENRGDVVSSSGIPAHGIWLIVAGGANSDIANLIYGTKSDGANMKGAVVVNIVTASNKIFPAAFDRPTATNLYIQFSIKTTSPGFVFDTTSIAAYIAANQTYSIGEFADTSEITTSAIAAIAAQGGGGVPVLVSVSQDGINWTDYLPSAGLNTQWTLDPSRITITVIP